MKIQEPRLWHRIYDGVLEGSNVEHYKKYLKQVTTIYKYGSMISDDDLEKMVYEVYSYSEGDKDKQGNLNWGLTVMNPVYVNGECNMTRGHFHEDRNCTEYYFGIEGEGLLLLMDEQGKMCTEKVCKSSLHYIDGRYAHRLVNTCDSVFKVGACWPTTAGHDYNSIEKKEFPFRVFKNDGKIEFIARD